MLQWSESAVCVHISPPSGPSPTLPHRRARAELPVSYSSFPRLSALYVAVYIRQRCSPSSSYPPPLTPLCPAAHHLIFSTPPVSSLYFRKFRIAEREEVSHQWTLETVWTLVKVWPVRHVHSTVVTMVRLWVWLRQYISIFFSNLSFREHK